MIKFICGSELPSCCHKLLLLTCLKDLNVASQHCFIFMPHLAIHVHCQTINSECTTKTAQLLKNKKAKRS